jgi:4-aminobutyrate aminotransferase-like enzyme
LVERSHRVGASFVRELERLARRHNAIKEVRGRGLMIAVELQDLPALSVYAELLERGFAVGCKPAANLLRFYPSLTIDEQDITQLLEHLDLVLGT